MAYANGEVPTDRLVTFASGWLPNEGTWYHRLPPGTYAKHLTLVALAKRNTGRTLQPSEGWSCYRPLSVQVYAKRVHGIWAATPGTSSHGMFWERIECAAIDYGNWSYVYNGDRAAFYRDVRAVGLEPGLISPQRGYPDEPWHVVDKKPWAAGAATGGGAVPFAPIQEPEEADMFGMYNEDNKNEETRRVLVGEFSFQLISAWHSNLQWRFVKVHNVKQGDWDETKKLVNARRASAGMKPV